MQAFEFDYCDTYESYGSGVMLEKNRLRMFRCDDCKVNKTVVKKSVNDSRFRCETCIQNQIQNEVQTQMPNSLILEMPTTVTTDDTTPQFSWRWLQFFT